MGMSIAQKVLAEVAPQLKRLGATAVEATHADTIVASFPRATAPAAKSALRETVDGVNLLVRTEGGPLGSRTASLDAIGSFIIGGVNAPAKGFGHAVDNPTVLSINVPNHAIAGLKQVVRDSVNVPGAVKVEYPTTILVPVA